MWACHHVILQPSLGDVLAFDLCSNKACNCTKVVAPLQDFYLEKTVGDPEAIKFIYKNRIFTFLRPPFI